MQYGQCPKCSKPAIVYPTNYCPNCDPPPVEPPPICRRRRVRRTKKAPGLLVPALLAVGSLFVIELAFIYSGIYAELWALFK